MRLFQLCCLCLLAGCSSDADRSGDAAPLTGDAKFDRCLARLQVVHVASGELPATNPGAPVKARATLAVKSGKTPPDKGDPHTAHIGVYEPAGGTFEEAGDDGGIIVAAGGTVLALLAGGGAVAWKLTDVKRRSGQVDIDPTGETPISIPTRRPANEGPIGLTVKTPQRTLEGTALVATDEAVAGTAGLVAGDAGPVTVTATQDGQVIGEETFQAVVQQIRWNPEETFEGTSSTLLLDVRPGGRLAVITIQLDAENVPNLLLPGATLTGGPGNWTITIQGSTDGLADVPACTVVAGKTHTQAALQVTITGGGK